MTGKEEEKEVICVEYGASPSEQVGQASGCLQSILEAPKYSFSRWTILDYSTAYNSKLITPRKVLSLTTRLALFMILPPQTFFFFGS